MKTEGLLAQRIVNVKVRPSVNCFKHSKMEHVISLAGGIPSDALFDFEGLSIATQQAITEQPKSAFQYGLTEGSPLLRERICALCAERSVTARAEEVMVTAGSQQALDLVMRAIDQPGDVFVVERPTYLAALQTLELAEANIMSVSSRQRRYGGGRAGRAAENPAHQGRVRGAELRQPQRHHPERRAPRTAGEAGRRT